MLTNFVKIMIKREKILVINFITKNFLKLPSMMLHKYQTKIVFFNHKLKDINGYFTKT